MQSHDNPADRQKPEFAYLPLWVFAVIRKHVRASSRLEAAEVYAVLRSFAGKDGHCFPQIETIAGRTDGLTPRTVRRWLERLAELGLYERRRVRYANGRVGGWEYVFPTAPQATQEVVPGPGATQELSQPPATQELAAQEPTKENPPRSVLEWTGPPDGDRDDKDQSNFVDWRPGDEDLFVSLMGCDEVEVDGERWRPAGRYPTLMLYRGLRKNRRWGWPGKYLETIDSNGGLDEWLFGEGIEPVCEPETPPPQSGGLWWRELSIRCRHCGAEPGQTCRTPNGSPVTPPHQLRRADAREATS